MLRAGARHPDADMQDASTSRRDQSGDQSTDWSQFYATLNEYLQLEPKFQPRLCLPSHSENGEVTVGARDGAAHMLRSLKVWFDLPTEVFIDAISLFDRFLTKMKVRPCHVPCITVSCLYLAIQKRADDPACKVPVEELVKISSSACTGGDVARMSRVIADKLSLVNDEALTLLHWLRLFAAPTRPLPVCEESDLLNLLEIAVCDAACVNARMSELALVLLFHKLEQDLVEISKRASAGAGDPVPDEVYFLYDFGAQLQAVCHMSDASLIAARQLHARVLSRYGARAAAPRQRLTWRLSERTLKVLRPTDRLTSLLPTIEEQHFTVDATPTRNRSGSESSEEETSDWPRSPVLPIYCDN